MQNDERDPQDVPPDEPAEVPPPEAPHEAPPAEPPEERADDEDEFETASWPTQDTSAAAPPPTPEADEAAASPEAAADPPPPEVEAYAAPPASAEPVVAAHSVPATEPGESTVCPRCGTENRPGIAFCRSCGQRLVAAGAPTTVERPSPPDGTQACPRCGTHNRAGVAFCQNCGANLRATAPGGVPAPGATPAIRRDPAVGASRAVLGPVVLLIGAIGVATAWLLPFPFGSGSLYDRAFGSSGGYGIAFWDAYRGIDGLASQAYFGFAAPAPLLIALLVLLAVGGIVRPAPAILQLVGLLVALVWAVGLAILFVVVEVLGGPGGGLIEILRNLTPGGIIFLLAGLIVVIGALTRIGKG